MDKPKSPCRKDCEYRSVGCHSDACPYGWAEYEKKSAEFSKFIENERNRIYLTAPITDANKRFIHGKTLLKKRMGKY